MKIARDDKEFLLCFFAGQAMQGILSNGSLPVDITPHSIIAADSVSYAKALLAELEAQDDA